MTEQLPAMTNPLGKHWRQPDRSEVLVDATHAVMSELSRKKLSTYSTTCPSGVYEGKMWRCEAPDGKQYLAWYGPSEFPDKCSINVRELLVVQS